MSIFFVILCVTGKLYMPNKTKLILIHRSNMTNLHLLVTPESIIIPIVSCILGFPLLALMVICCLRRRAKLARERARRRNCDLDHGALSLVRFSPVHRLGEPPSLKVKLGHVRTRRYSLCE